MSKVLSNYFPPAWTLPQNLSLLTSPMRLPKMAKAMEQMISTSRLTTPVAQPSGLLLDTVTWDDFGARGCQHFGPTVIGMVPSKWGTE